jgi:malate dehydrogenase (oxaloacetate-decarboxylating)
MGQPTPVTVDAERVQHVDKRGLALILDPLLNKGTCFTEEERDLFGLHGLLPPGVSTAKQQEERSYGNYLRAGGDILRYLYLQALRDRNETLFFRLLVNHLEEMAPIVYTPTVGTVCEQYSQLYRQTRGLYVSVRDRGRVAQLLKNLPRDDYRVLVVTDNEAVLGLGDLGVGGMGISIGKLALYTAGAGVHPALTLPVTLDVGTNNKRLLEDPIYLGMRHPRLRGEEYDALLDELVDAVSQVFPKALVQWEDFASANAFKVYERHRNRILSFNDDIQGTACVFVAGVRSALAQVGRRLEDERVVFYGAGAAGGGCSLALKRAMAAAGVSDAEFRRRVLLLDSHGLILADRPTLPSFQKEIAGDPALLSEWKVDRGSFLGLADVVRLHRPTILVGASGQPGSFTEEIVRTMLASCARPIFFPLSNPTSHIEALPEDLIRWTDGTAVVGTGSPFAPVEWKGVRHEIGQGNNALIFPGLGLGAVAVGAKHLPDEAFLAASNALFELNAKNRSPGTPIYPPLTRLREVSFAVACAVAKALVETGAAPSLPVAEVPARVRATMWEPEYPRYLPARSGP